MLNIESVADLRYEIFLNILKAFDLIFFCLLFSKSYPFGWLCDRLSGYLVSSADIPRRFFDRFQWNLEKFWKYIENHFWVSKVLCKSHLMNRFVGILVFVFYEHFWKRVEAIFIFWHFTAGFYQTCERCQRKNYVIANRIDVTFWIFGTQRNFGLWSFRHSKLLLHFWVPPNFSRHCTKSNFLLSMLTDQFKKKHDRKYSLVFFFLHWPNQSHEIFFDRCVSYPFIFNYICITFSSSFFLIWRQK